MLPGRPWTCKAEPTAQIFPDAPDRVNGRLATGDHSSHSAPMAGVVPPRVVEREVRIEGLDPRHEGVRIAQLSDLHVGDMTPASHIRAAVEAANGANADLIALT